MSTTRRSFLQLGLIGAGVLAVGGVGLGLRGTVYRAPSRPLKALTPRGFSILSAVADRLLDYGPKGPTAAELGIAEQVDAFLATAHPATVAEVEQALALLENAAAGALLEGRFQTFTASTPEAQERALLGWSHASIPLFRKAYRGLHSLCTGPYFGDPRTYAAVGYPGPPDFGGARP